MNNFAMIKIYAKNRLLKIWSYDFTLWIICFEQSNSEIGLKKVKLKQAFDFYCNF